MKFVQFSFDSYTFCLSPDVLWSTLFPSPLLSYRFLLMTPLNIFKIQATENHNPVLLRYWAHPRLLLISVWLTCFYFFRRSLGIYMQVSRYYAYMGTGQCRVRPRLCHLIVHHHTPLDLM